MFNKFNKGARHREARSRRSSVANDPQDGERDPKGKRMLIEQLQPNMLFRWFVGMEMDEAVESRGATWDMYDGEP
jgi:hypothetical protein